MTAYLQDYYKSTVADALKKKFSYENVMEIPKLSKIVLNMGVGEAVADKKILDFALEDLAAITGQKAVKTIARRSVAGFKIREGWPIGCKVTLRGERMYEFLHRLIHIAIPRIRDFRGFSVRGFDGRGNYNLGVTEQIVFPEINYDKIDAIRGMDITIVTTAKTNAEGAALLAEFQFPFKDLERVN